MNRLLPAACSLTLMLAALPLTAQTAAGTAPTATGKARAGQATTDAASRKRAAARPAGAGASASASNILELPLSPAQLAAAERVHTGRADCEKKQSVQVDRVAGQPGHFDVRFGARSFRMVPEETTTGAVRLHDHRAQVVWLQIPSKSMMLDQRAGQRLVDVCLHAEQREGGPTQVAVSAVDDAASKPAAPAAGSLLEPAR